MSKPAHPAKSQVTGHVPSSEAVQVHHAAFFPAAIVVPLVATASVAAGRAAHRGGLCRLGGFMAARPWAHELGERLLGIRSLLGPALWH
jgi:hypothetical protein